MNPLFHLRNLQNSLNFAIRSRLTFKGPAWRLPWATSAACFDEETLSLQRELVEFLELFDWSRYHRSRTSQASSALRFADVGARDFSFGPVFEKFFEFLDSTPEIYGIEIDAYRRYRDFTTRADRGRAFASVMANGHYLPGDFLDFELPVDGIFLLHPFVTPEPPLRWGLPLSTFRPSELFGHASKLLKPFGFLLLSCPSENEFKIAIKMALEAGFQEFQRGTWMPGDKTRHLRPRFGALFTK